jgi:hypothetical protein
VSTSKPVPQQLVFPVKYNEPKSKTIRYKADKKLATKPFNFTRSWEAQND